MMALVFTAGCIPPTFQSSGTPLPSNTNYALVPSTGCPDTRVKDPRYAPTQRADSIDRYTVIRSASVRNGSALEPALYVSASKFVHSVGSSGLFLNAQYFAKEWLFIDAGNSLTLIADGQRLELSGEQSNRDVMESATISEAVHYPITADQIRALAKASAITARIRGSKGYQDFALSGDTMCAIRRFALDAL